MDENYSVKLSKVIGEFDLESLYLPDLPENILITCTRVNRPGLQMVGFYDHYEQQRLQIIGIARAKRGVDADVKPCRDGVFDAVYRVGEMRAADKVVVDRFIVRIEGDLNAVEPRFTQAVRKLGGELYAVCVETGDESLGVSDELGEILAHSRLASREGQHRYSCVPKLVDDAFPFIRTELA